MKRFNTLRRVIRTGVFNMLRNAWLAIAAVAVMVVTLTIILFSMVANETFSHTIETITSKINISIYLNDEVTDEQRNRLMGQLRELDNVKEVRYISKTEALKQFRNDKANSQNLQQAILETGNPLPSSIRVDPVDPARIQEIKEFLDRPVNKAFQDPQAETSYSGERKEAVDNITHATGILQRVGSISVVVFAVISMLIIFNTIQMAIFNRRDELTIMRLLGATTWYIRGPFVVESIIYGIVAAVASILLINSVFVTAASALQASSFGLLDIGYASTYFRSHFWMLSLMQVIIGVLIGATSSVIATQRYLKFKTSK